MKKLSKNSALIGAVCAVMLAALFAGGILGKDFLSLPFTLIAAGLRLLSLSGSIGNIFAIILLVLLGFSPLLLKRRRKWQAEDLLLVLAVVLIWYALYYLINPGLLPVVLGGGIGELILSGSVYSVVLSWGVIRLVKHQNSADNTSPYRVLRIFLILCAVSHLLSITVEFSSFLTHLRVVDQTNTMMGVNLAPTHLFLFLRFVSTAGQHLLNGWILWLGAKLVARLQADPYSEESGSASRKAVVWCKRALVIITLSDTALNLAQVFFAPYLHQLAAQFTFPLSSLAVIFAMMVLSNILVKGKALKDDNDLFI